MSQISLFCIFGSNIAFLHSNSYFDINIGSNISFLHSKSYFRFQNWAEYCVLLHFLTSILGPNIAFFHLESYFDIQNWSINRLLYIQKYILTFETGPNITFFYFFDIVIRPNAALIFYSGPNIAFSQSKFKIVQNMTFLEIQNPIFRFKWVIFQLFLHAKFYFDIQNWAKYHFLHFYIQIGIKYRFFTFKFLFWHQYWAKYLFLTIKILFSISKLGWLLFFPTFFDILIGTKYRLFNLES